MKAKLHKITLTLDEEVARWVRKEAARKKTNISHLLDGILKECMLERDAYEAAMRRALRRKPFLYLKGGDLSRAEAHVRTRLS